MQYTTSSKQEEHLFVSKSIKKSGSPQRQPIQPQHYFNGAKKLQYNLPSLVEEPPSYYNNKNSQEIGVHFVPRDNYNRQIDNSNNIVYNKMMKKNSHPIGPVNQNQHIINNKKGHKIDWQGKNSLESEHANDHVDHYTYEAVNRKISAPKSAFEENGNPQPSNFNNGEYDDSNNLQPANYYYPPRPQHPYRGDQGGPNDLNSDPDDTPPYIPQRRLIHLDLKGAPPKMDYLLKILKLSRELGITGVLLEYEDMFPFHGKLAKVAATNHYNVSDIKMLIESCEQLNLDVIPLVQTFGHMEFILKLSDFAHLRDAEDMPESICSCNDKAMPLLEEYIDQVMQLHPNVRYLHIGCDEVFHMGECESCVIKGEFIQFILSTAWAKSLNYNFDTLKLKI